MTDKDTSVYMKRLHFVTWIVEILLDPASANRSGKIRQRDKVTMTDQRVGIGRTECAMYSCNDVYMYECLCIVCIHLYIYIFTI